ncbi:hypothetical protein ACLOJK_022905 [Asimina triloba]
MYDSEMEETGDKGFYVEKRLSNEGKHPENPQEGERDFTMNNKEYKAYFSLPTRRAVTVADLLPVRCSRSNLWWKLMMPEGSFDPHHRSPADRVAS